MGNPAAVAVLQSGRMTHKSGNVIYLQLLDAGNDPNKELQPFEAIAHPASALTATAYALRLLARITGPPSQVALALPAGISANRRGARMRPGPVVVPEAVGLRLRGPSSEQAPIF
jgi:hypothetical protein